MVDRINGAVYQGVWVEKDVRFVTLTATGTTYLTDLRADNSVAQKAEGVNSDLEVAMEVLSTRGTILGINVASDTVVTVMLGYANAFTVGNTEGDAGSVEEEVSLAIIAGSGATAAGIAVAEGFAAATPGTPA